MPTYADPDLVAQLRQENSFHVIEDAGLSAAYPFAEEVEVLTGNVAEAGAASVAARLTPFGAPAVGGWLLTLLDRNFEVEVLETVAIRAPSLWGGTRSFLVRGVGEDCNSNQSTLKLTGGAA